MDHWRKIVDMMHSGMTVEEIENELSAQRRAEIEAMELDHRRRMWRDVTLPFLVGMTSLAWAVGVIALGGPVWLALASMPGVVWCQWKLAPFMFGNTDH